MSEEIQQEQNKEQSNNNSGKKEKYDVISFEVEEKLRKLEELCVGKTPEQILNIRIDMLSLSKILVFTHGKSQFILTQAHVNLGEAYLNFDCHEQAIDHLMVAQKKNGKLFQEIPESKLYHTNILILLGKCYLVLQQYEDSLEFFKNADQLTLSLDEKDNSQTLTLMAGCYYKMGIFDTSIQYYQEAIKIQEQFNGENSEQVAMVCVEMARVYCAKEDLQTAIDYQEQAIKTLEECKYQKKEFIAQLYEDQAEYFQKFNRIDDQLRCLKQVKKITQELFAQDDKRIIKIKRAISINLLKNENHAEALQELLETEDMELRVYGESSLDVAKTQKIIGTLFILIHQYKDAQKYLNMALKTFDEHGMKKTSLEIRQKLKLSKEIKDNNEIDIQQELQ